MTDLQKTEKTFALIKMLEGFGFSANASWDDYAAGLVSLGADLPSLEAMRRCGHIVPSANSFRLSK